ncbi:uncharacterized protein rab44 isoform X5 [Sander lucioperca]|uniref:uncharacterized protein rab44 isoform X5 n=1 Tax=Sander lucioperca TaxID=283035 RepID=UPI00125E7434|nr:uncharacterized protein rab44 isoform X5 [Sander lucioperca]
MSTPSAKKRLGSRRRGANQNEISKNDEFHITDNTFVVECVIPEEKTESLNVLVNPDNLTTETQHPPSPELSGNRRKLGSRRRNKLLHVEDSATESCHEPIEEVEEKTRVKETTVTKQMSLAIQSKKQEVIIQGSEYVSITHEDYIYSAATPKVQYSTTTNCPKTDLESLIPKSENLQADLDENETDSKVVYDSCKLVDTVQEGIDRSDSLRNEEVKESAHLVGISELTSLSVLSCPGVDQQLIDQFNVRQMPEEKLSNVHSVTEKECKERDDNTELLRKDGNLQGNYLVSESHVESVAMQFCTTPEITTEKISPRENTEIEQATISSPKEEFPTDEKQNEHSNLFEVKCAHRSEDAVNNVHEQEVKPTQIKEMPQIDDSSESVIHDATGNSKIISGNLTDKTEVSDTYQSELIVKRTDEFPINQDISIPADKQHEHSKKESNFEAVEQKNKGYYVSDTKKPQISNIEGVDTAPGQIYETKGRQQDDTKPSAEQTGHQDKEGLVSEMESESSLQTLQSEINAPFDFQPQHSDTGFNPIGNRRKLGSSRKNKGRQHVKDSVAESYNVHKEDVESTGDNEAFETRQTLLAIERTSQSSQGSESDIKPATHDSSLYTAIMPGYSSDVQGPTTTNYPEADLESSKTKSENPRDDHDERGTDFKVEVSDKSVGSTLEGTDQSDTLQSQEVTGAHNLEDAVNTVHEQEVKPTEMQELPQIDYASESVIHDATENSEIISGNLADQTEVSDTYQCDLIVKRTGDSPTNQKISNSDKQDEHPTKENNFESLERKNEDCHIYDIKEPQISHIDRVDTALGQIYETEGRVQDDTKPSAEQTGHQDKEGLVSEMESESSLQTLQSEINAPFDFQPQHSDTGFNPIGNRRKLGSSRKNKGRQHVKDSVAESYHEPTEEVVGDTRDNEPLETTEMSLSIEPAVKEKSMETMLEEMDQFDTAQTEDVRDQVKENALVGGDLHSSLTVDQQMIDQSNSTEMPEEELSNVCFVKEENKEGDEDTELFRHDGNVQTHYKPTEEVVGDTRDNEPLETTEMSLSIEPAVKEKSMETMLEEMDQFDTAQTEDVRDQVKENALVGIDLHSSLTVDQLSKSTAMPDEELPNVCFVIEKENKESDDNRELFRQDGNLQTNYLVSVSRVKSEDIDYSITPEITTDKPNPKEHTEPECSVEQAILLSPKEELSTSEEQKEHVNLSQVRGARHSEDAVNEVHEEEVKPTQMHQIDNFSIKESQSSLQTLHSEMNAPLNSQPFDSYQSIKGQTPTGNRRKFGSNRKNKGLQVKDTTKMSLVTETMRQEELKEQTNLDFKPTGEIRQFRSTVNDEENTEKMSEEGTILSQNVMDSSTIVTTDMPSSSGKDDFVKSKEVTEMENKLIKETENLSQLTGCDTVKMDLTQSPNISVWKDDSDIQNISYHDENVTTKPIAEDVLEQEGAFQVHDTEALSCDKEMNMQQTNDTSQIVGDVTIKAYNSGAESSMCVQVSRQDKDGEQFEELTKKDHEAQEMNVSQVITHAELFSASQNKTDTMAPFDIGLEENIQAKPAEDVSEERGISSQQRIQEKTNLDDSEHLQGRSKQKRRKMGSTRQTQLNRKPEEKRGETKESDFNTEADMRNVDKMEAMEDLQISVTAEVSQNEHAKPSLSPKNKEQHETSTVHDNRQKLQRSDLQSIQSNMISDRAYSNTLLPELSASHSKEVVNPVKFVHVTDVRDSESNVDVSVEPSQLDDFTTTEMHITSVSFVSLCETTQSAQNDEKWPESVNVINDQALKLADEPVVADLEIMKSVVRGGAQEEHMSAQASKQEPDKANEEAHTKNLEMKNANLDSTNKRRKMGSTRRSLGSRTKREDMYEKQEEDNEATEVATIVGVLKTESFSGNIGVLQLHEDSGSEQRKEKEFETVEYCHTGESYFKPPQTFEENPVSHGQLVETEHQLTPNYLPTILSTSPKHDLMSESAFGRKRRKMGSHRKSHGHQNYENQTAKGDKITDAQNGSDVRSITDESANKTTEELREESLGPDKISEVNTIDKKPSSNISTSKAAEQPVSEKKPKEVTPVQHPYAEIHLAQESQQKFSLAGNSRAADLQSNTYNVIMVGDSSVGKTSFMKRAQSGKFSLDIPASVGLDSCMWTVVVDGKHVVLQLWDTAGQERFHSMTRQIFHKANAFLLMYDITSSQSFSAISYWASCIQEGAAENVTILLVGNKSDCAERQVKTQEVEVLAKEYNFEFMECSAATGENVVQSLETVARMLSQKVDTREEAMELHKEPNKKKSSGCC